MYHLSILYQEISWWLYFAYHQLFLISDRVLLCNEQDRELFSDKDGLPRKAFPNGWKGEKGLYSVGFTRRGLMGTSVDARRIAHDIEQQLKTQGLYPDVLF